MGTRIASITVVLALAAGGALLASSSSSDDPTLRSCESVAGSEVCTWVTIDRDEVTELGASIPLTLVESVPLDAEMVFPPEALGVVELPPEARDRLGIDHLVINWEAHGHPPAAFLTRHFDFHFYSVPQDVVQAIDCADEAKPTTVPPGYVLPDVEIPGMGTLVGLCVPNMGMHAMPQAEAGQTHAFRASMMMGYYAGAPVFFEPMVAQETLLERSDFSIPMPRVDDLPPGVRYPSAFRAEYDANSDAYRLIFTGFDQP
jgi:hypothetical protein